MSRQAQDRGEGGGAIRFGGRRGFFNFFFIGCYGGLHRGKKGGGVEEDFDEWAFAMIFIFSPKLVCASTAAEPAIPGQSFTLTQKRGKRVCV